jgi:hypothetical protein
VGKPAVVLLLALLLAAGCSSQGGKTGTSGTTIAPTTTAAAATTTSTIAARARCAISPESGTAGSRVTLTCSGFAPAERVAITFLAEVLTTAKATTRGDVASSFAVPSGFAGAHYPGRKDTFQAKGRQSGKVASATFTVTG